MTALHRADLQVRVRQSAFRTMAFLHRHPALWSAGLLVVAMAAFAWFQAGVIPKMGFWLDELFSLWAADPGIPFGQAFSERILPDTNGPVYFSLLHLVQQTGIKGRAAFVVLNLAVIGLLLGLMVERGARMGMIATALTATALVLIGAPVLAYVAEGRVYAMAMALCCTLAFVAGGRTVGGSVERSDLILAAILAALAAWMHVFAAVFAGSLAAALVLTGWLVLKRRDLVLLGFVMGLSATLALLLWLAIGYQMFAKAAGEGFWIEFTPHAVFEAFWMMKEYAIGPLAGAAIGVAFVGLSLLRRDARAAALLLVITGLLFVALPLAASLVKPMLLGRYLLIGGPALLVMCVILLRAHLAGGGRPGWRYGLAGLGCAFLLVPVTQGMPTAGWHFATRTDWRGAEVVRPLMAQCPEGEIRTLTSVPGLFGFDYYLKGALRAVAPSIAPVRDVASIDCPVLGWAEHNVETEMSDDWYKAADMPRVLAEFRLTNTEGQPLEIVRHPGGLVLVRAETAPAAARAGEAP